MNAEQFSQRLVECRLLDQPQVNQIYSTFAAREITAEDFKREAIQREWLTNWQIQRIEDGHRRGYFYGHWKVQYLVGLGTFARVYRGVHTKTGDVKAVKVLRNRYGQDLETQERFMREAGTVMRLRHPNIVPIYEVEREQGRAYMVMDFIEGQNLRDFVRIHGKLKLLVALNIIRDVSSGLDYALRNGITHRDLKLSNVLLSSTGKASLVDFGLAVIDKTMADAPGFSPRSVDYAGLEKNTGVDRDDKRSDIFFLGCMLYHMVAGRPPLFETRERMRRMSGERFREIPPVTNFVQLPHRIVFYLRRLMELDAEKRIQTPIDALREVDDLIDEIKSGQVSSYSKSQSEQDQARHRRRTKRYTEGADRTVMLLEPKPDVQDQLRQRLKKLGYRVLIMSDPRRALSRFEDLDQSESDPADCVLFSLPGLGPEGLDAFNFFAGHQRMKKIPAILMHGEDQDYLRDKADLCEHRRPLLVPTKFSEIRQMLRELLNITSDDELDEI